MKKLSVNKLIEFSRKNYKGKLAMVEKMKSSKIEPPLEAGGNYWISCLSAISQSFKQNDLEIIEEKIEELKEKFGKARAPITKDMYKRNVAALEKYKSMDIKKHRPKEEITILKKSTGKSLLSIRGLQIEAKPNHIYTYGKEGVKKVGAVWFIAKINEYRLEELGVFCEMLYRFLKHNYSRSYEINPKYCLVVDVWTEGSLDYSQIEKGAIKQMLIPTLDEIVSLMCNRQYLI